MPYHALWCAIFQINDFTHWGLGQWEIMKYWKYEDSNWNKVKKGGKEGGRAAGRKDMRDVRKEGRKDGWSKTSEQQNSQKLLFSPHTLQN